MLSSNSINENESSVKKILYIMPYFMWCITLIFLMFQFILRLWPGLIIKEIMLKSDLDAQQFGILASFYYYGYALAQIPIAVALDRFNFKYTLSFFIFICGLSQVIFSNTDSFILLCVTRFLIGATSASAILSVTKVISTYFSIKNYNTMLGLSFSIGLIGAVYGGAPVSELLENIDYKLLGIYFGYIAIIISILVLILFRNKKTSTYNSEIKQDEGQDSPSNNQSQNNISNLENKFTLKDYINLLFTKQIIILGIVNLLLVGVLEGLSDVWGVSFLMEKYELTKQDASLLISYIYIGMIIGAPLITYASSYFSSYSMIILCGLFIGGLLIILPILQYSSIIFSSIFILLGVFSCYQTLILAIGAKISLQHSTIIFAFLNCINMLGGSFFHTIIGTLVTKFLTYNTTEIAYMYGLSIIPISAIIGAFLMFFIKDNKKT